MPLPVTEMGLTDDVSALYDRVARLERRAASFSEADGGGRVNGARDRYTIASTVTTVYALTFIPRKDTLNLFLNGVALDEGVDYSVDYTAPSITLTASAGRAVGDVLWARYLTTSATAGSSPSTTLIWGIRSDTAKIIGTFNAVALIEPGTPFTDISAHLDPLAGDVCLVFGCSSLFDPTVNADYLLLRVGTSPGLYHFNRTDAPIDASDADTLIVSIPSLTGAADYSVTVSGTTLTTKRNGVTEDTTTLTGADAAALSRSIVGLRGDYAASSGVATNFSAAAGTVTDAFSRPDADQLGHADTGQVWVGTS